MKESKKKRIRKRAFINALCVVSVSCFLMWGTSSKIIGVVFGVLSLTLLGTFQVDIGKRLGL